MMTKEEYNNLSQNEQWLYHLEFGLKTRRCMCGERLKRYEPACPSCLAEMDRAMDILDTL